MYSHCVRLISHEIKTDKNVLEILRIFDRLNKFLSVLDWVV